MVRKIQSNEYLKRYDNMTAQEMETYESMVAQWLNDNAEILTEKGDSFAARMQNVLQISTTWNDQECQAFEDGARLLSALVPTADTWLPEMLYIKSAKRSIRQMVMTLGTVGSEAKEESAEGTSKETQTVATEGKFVVKASDANTVNAGTGAAAPFQDKAGNGDIPGGDNKGEVQVDLVPARPKHIDQYIHLLPQKTQEHAALVQGLYREMEEARQKLELLTDDKSANAADREAWAKKATKCDNTLRKIFDELDAEWAKLVQSGRVVVDDLGNARVVSSPQNDETQKTVELTSEQKARRRDLRKWLVDTRRGNGDTREEHVQKWTENFKEYLTLEGAAAYDDDKIMAAMKHYGIETKKVK